MANIDEVKGITKKKVKPVVKRQDDDSENQFISKEEFIAKRKIIKDADQAAENARIEHLKKNGKTEVDPKVALKEKQLKVLRLQLANAEKSLKEKDSQSNRIKVTQLSKELEDLENKAV